MESVPRGEVAELKGTRAEQEESKEAGGTKRKRKRERGGGRKGAGGSRRRGRTKKRKDSVRLDSFLRRVLRRPHSLQASSP